MPIYSYKAIDNQGKLHKGSIPADSPGKVYQIAKNQGLTLIKVYQFRSFFKKGFSFQSLNDSFLHLEHFVKSQISVTQAIKILIQSSHNRNVVKTWQEVLLLIENGLKLYQALEKFSHIFPLPVIYLIMVGEKIRHPCSGIYKCTKMVTKKI